MRYFLYILLAIVILLVMIVIHELGHYVAGKILKFKINEFSIGFGPQLLSKTNKKTGEKFTLRLIPLGGYCAFEDESGLAEEESGERVVDPDTVFPEASNRVMPPSVDELRAEEAPAEKPRSFVDEKPWKRIIVLFAGAFFNFVSAIIFSFIFILAVGFPAPEIVDLYKSDAGTVYQEELQVGDVILAVNGTNVGIMNTYDDLTSVKDVGTEYVLTIDRGGETVKAKVTVKRIVNTLNPDEPIDYVGLGFASQTRSIKCGFTYALTYCVPYTCKLAFLVLSSLGGIITGRTPLTSMTGPVGTVGAMAQLGMTDLRNFLVLLPLIAANLAIFNILPIPALDGSKIIFTIIEWIRKKPVNRKVENIIHSVGLLLLFGFVIVIDLVGLFV